MRLVNTSSIIDIYLSYMSHLPTLGIPHVQRLPVIDVISIPTSVDPERQANVTGFHYCDTMDNRIYSLRCQPYVLRLLFDDASEVFIRSKCNYNLIC
jgi:hypothetical protein